MAVFKIIGTCIGLFVVINASKAQYNNYDWNKKSQKQREKENQAYIDARIPENTKRADNSGNSNSDNYYDRLAEADRKKREDDMNAERKRNENAQSEKEKKERSERFRQSIAMVPRIPENYSTLINIAIDNGFSKSWALDVYKDLNPSGKLEYKPGYRYVTYTTGPAKVLTPEEIIEVDKIIESSRKQDSINKINDAINKNIQNNLKLKLDDAMAAYSKKDYSNAALYFDSSLGWKDLEQPRYYKELVAAGKTFRKLGAFDKSIAILLKNHYYFQDGSGLNPEFTREFLRYEASISAIYAGDFANAISLGRVYEGNQFKYIESATNTSDNAALNRSYCQFLLKTTDPATQLTTLPYYVDSNQDWSARLVRIYFSLKKDDLKYVKEQIKLFAKENTSVKFEGEISTKLAGMLFFESKKLSTTHEVPVQALYLLDLAIDLLPENKEFVQTRYNLNTLLKRSKFAEADAVLLGLK